MSTIRQQPLFHKRHYEVIARILRSGYFKEDFESGGFDAHVVAMAFVEALKADNPSFDQIKFLAAVDGWPTK